MVRAIDTKTKLCTEKKKKRDSFNFLVTLQFAQIAGTLEISVVDKLTGF